MTPEGKVKQKVLKWLKDNLPGHWGYSPPGGPFGKGGIPDRIGLWRGIFFAIEMKRDRTNEPSALQWNQIEQIKSNGGIVAVLYGYEEHKLIAIKNRIIERTPNHDSENVVQGLPVSNAGRLVGIFSPEGDC